MSDSAKDMRFICGRCEGKFYDGYEAPKRYFVDDVPVFNDTDWANLCNACHKVWRDKEYRVHGRVGDFDEVLDGTLFHVLDPNRGLSSPTAKGTDMATTTNDREFLEDLDRQLDEQLKTDPCDGCESAPGGLTNDGDMAVDFAKDPSGTPKGNFYGWLWPMPYFDDPIGGAGYPVITGNEFKPTHLGRDVALFNRLGSTGGPPEYYGGRDDQKYYVPTGKVPMLAMGPGHIWYAGNAEMGWTIKIDHHDWVGFPLVTYYTHMSKLFVPEWDRQAGGLLVQAGQPIGIVGAGPTHANHAHVEFLDFSPGVQPGRVNRAMDPKLFIPHFGTVVRTLALPA